MDCFGRKLQDLFLRVVLLDNSEATVCVAKKQKGHHLLQQVFDRVNLVETEYFGLRYMDIANQTYWLDEEKSIGSQLLRRSSNTNTLYLSVKYYSPDPGELKEEITRYQFFLQLKRDILQGRLPVGAESASQLGAFAVQSELGDYDERRHVPGYVSEFRFVPDQTPELEDAVERLHATLTGQTPEDAELCFLRRAKWLDLYGIDTHLVTGEGNVEYTIGLTPMGVIILRNQTKVGSYAWPRITKISLKRRHFFLRVRDKTNEDSVYAFEVASKTACKHLWRCAVDQHLFFTGRSQKTAAPPVERKAPRFDRAPSRRYQRRSGGPIGWEDDGANVGRRYRNAKSLSRLDPDGHDAASPAEMPTQRMLAPAPTNVINKTPTHARENIRQRDADRGANDSPRSTRSAPWEVGGTSGGLYTSGESPLSVRSSRSGRNHHSKSGDRGHRHHRRRNASGAESEGGGRHRRRRHRRRREHGGDEDDDVKTNEDKVRAKENERGESDEESEKSSGSRRRRQRRSRDPGGRDSGDESESSRRRSRRICKSGEFGSREGIDGATRKSAASLGGIATRNDEAGSERSDRSRRRRAANPPEEIRHYIHYGLVEPPPTGVAMNAIPYTSVGGNNERTASEYSAVTNRTSLAASRSIERLDATLPLSPNSVVDASFNSGAGCSSVLLDNSASFHNVVDSREGAVSPEARSPTAASNSSAAFVARNGRVNFEEDRAASGTTEEDQASGIASQRPTTASPASMRASPATGKRGTPTSVPDADAPVVYSPPVNKNAQNLPSGQRGQFAAQSSATSNNRQIPVHHFPATSSASPVIQQQNPSHIQQNSPYHQQSPQSLYRPNNQQRSSATASTSTSSPSPLASSSSSYNGKDSNENWPFTGRRQPDIPSPDGSADAGENARGEAETRTAPPPTAPREKRVTYAPQGFVVGVNGGVGYTDSLNNGVGFARPGGQPAYYARRNSMLLQQQHNRNYDFHHRQQQPEILRHSVSIQELQQKIHPNSLRQPPQHKALTANQHFQQQQKVLNNQFQQHQQQPPYGLTPSMIYLNEKNGNVAPYHPAQPHHQRMQQPQPGVVGVPIYYTAVPPYASQRSGGADPYGGGVPTTGYY